MTSASPPEKAPNASPTGAKLLEAFISLSRELHLTMGEEDLIKLFVRVFGDLFPGRLLCIRLLDQKSMALSQVYANGRLREDVRSSVCLSEESCKEHELNDEASSEFIASKNIAVSKSYEPVFVGSAAGFDIPVCDGNVLYGVVNLEYAEGAELIETDRAIAVPLVHQMCAALRNARLLTETTMLKEYLETLLDCANAPVLVVDRKRRITVVNQAFERHTGYHRSDILKMDLMSLIPESEQSRLLPVILAVTRNEHASNFEVRIPKADGKGIAHIAFNAAAVFSRFRETEGIIFVGQDLTEIRALQNQVIHSEKLSTLGQVTAGVVHELNNPLTSISVYASYLAKKLEGKIEEPDLERLKRIVDSAGRIQAFTRDLVSYARPSSEEPSLIKVSNLLEKALSFCEHLIDESEADVVLDVADNLEPIYGIRGQLEQVFVNLLTNACHALPESGGTITVSARAIDEERIEMSVKDTGHGIPQELLSQVFEPFYTSKPVGQGTGLGLSIVRNILVNHNAKIKVESEVGKGTTFAITIYSR